jgi:hypothetical protein
VQAQANGAKDDHFTVVLPARLLAADHLAQFGVNVAIGEYSRERGMTKCQGESYRRGLAGEYLREALSSTIVIRFTITLSCAEPQPVRRKPQTRPHTARRRDRP